MPWRRYEPEETMESTQTVVWETDRLLDPETIVPASWPPRSDECRHMLLLADRPQVH